VPSPDGKTLYYLAMKVPAFEADRFAIMALDLSTGAKRDVDPSWGRSPGSMQIAPDSKTLFVTVDDQGQRPLLSSGKLSKLVSDGSVGGYTLASQRVLLTRDDLKRPADLYTVATDGHDLKQVTHFNAARLKNAKIGDVQFFTFKGWNGETVQGYVVKPVNYKAGHKYPIAFIIHGGPQGAMNNDWGYRWNPQTYAGQGFAVVPIRSPATGVASRWRISSSAGKPRWTGIIFSTATEPVRLALATAAI
jgi:dipeptidyl aminopeptidase/acylaminoacyl peptidase